MRCLLPEKQKISVLAGAKMGFFHHTGSARVIIKRPYHVLGILTAMLDIVIVVSLAALMYGAKSHEPTSPLTAVLLGLVLITALSRSLLTFVSIRLLKWQANHDPVTKLPNQQLFQQRLSHFMAAEGSSSVALYLINIDRFKLFIGSLGYLTCNKLIVAVAQRLASKLENNPNVQLYRFEADTFGLVAFKPEKPRQIAAWVLEALHQPVYIDHREFCVTVSVGFSLYPQDGRNATRLLHAADLALQQAKKRGGNAWCRYRPEFEHPTPQPLALEGYLRHAIDHNELELYFQPQIRLDDGGLCGAEITLRWHHPEYQLLNPQDFIPMAEETGLIGPITEWIMQEACQQLLAWRRASFKPIRLAVNISAQQFHQQKLPELLERMLQIYPVAPHWLELEITESVAMLDIEHTTRTLERLKQIGVLLALDDFGTGFSSLSYLRRFPIDTLKLDRSFITSIENDPKSAAIACGVVTLGHNLQLKTLAEGIETRGQWALLQACGCDEGQGFLFGKPMPAKSFEILLHQSGTGAEKAQTSNAKPTI